MIIQSLLFIKQGFGITSLTTAKMKEIIFIFIQHILAPSITLVFGFFIGISKEKRSRKRKHDLSQFDKFRQCISNDEILKVIDCATNSACLPPETLCKGDELYDKFIGNPENIFISKSLNQEFSDLVRAIHELGQLYAYSNFGNSMHDGSFKLLYNKNHRRQKEMDELLKENLRLSKKVFSKYNDFRQIIRNELYT